MRSKLTILLILLQWANIQAKEKDPTEIIEKAYATYVDSLNNAIQWQYGTFSIHNNMTKMNIPKGFRFMNAEQSCYILEEVWGNLKDSSVLGMIFPIDKGPFDTDFTPFVISYNPIGYVKDDDANDIDYTELLKNLKEESAEENKERVKQNLSPLFLVNWAQAPFYDKEKNILHWAKEFKSSDSTENTLNYEIRVLGRKGVLSINAIGYMSQLPEVKKHINDIIAMATFNQGHRYEDFDDNVDDVAAWTIGSLVAGKVLAKVGFFAIFAKFFKFILLGLTAAGGTIWKFITGRKKKAAKIQEDTKESTNTTEEVQVASQIKENAPNE